MNARLALCLLLAVSAVPAWAMTPDEAYAAIPHRRTAYDAATSSAGAQSAGLARLFAMTDRGVVLRVEGMRAHASRDVGELRRVLADYDSLIDAMRSERFDAPISPARDLVVGALQGHKRFLASRPAGGVSLKRADLSQAPEVREASRNLHDAYNVLMRQFRGEPSRNANAFYDHLCALDFL